MADESEVAVFSMGLLVEGSQLLQAFLTTMRCACQRKLAIGVEIQQRLQVELGARKSNRSGDAAATMQGIEIINHKQGLHEIARLFRPGNHLFGGKSAFALTQSLQHQQTFRSRADKKIYDIDRRFGVLGFQLAPNGISRTVVAGKAAGKAEVYRGNARFNSIAESSFRFGGCNLRGAWSSAVSDVVVELLGRYGLIEIVLERFIVNDVVEIDQLNALSLDEFQWEVAARVDDEIALSGHNIPFQTSALPAL